MQVLLCRPSKSHSTKNPILMLNKVQFPAQRGEEGTLGAIPSATNVPIPSLPYRAPWKTPSRIRKSASPPVRPVDRAGAWYPPYRSRPTGSAPSTRSRARRHPPIRIFGRYPIPQAPYPPTCSRLYYHPPVGSPPHHPSISTSLPGRPPFLSASYVQHVRDYPHLRN